MLTSYKTIYAIAAVLLIMAGLLVSAPYPTDLSLEVLGCVLFFVASIKSKRFTTWHIVTLAGFSTAVFWFSVFLSSPQFLGFRLPPFNGPIEAGIHPFAGVTVIWGLMILLFTIYEVAFVLLHLLRKNAVKQSAWGIVGIAAQCLSLFYVYKVSEGI